MRRTRRLGPASDCVRVAQGKVSDQIAFQLGHEGRIGPVTVACAQPVDKGELLGVEGSGQ